MLLFITTFTAITRRPWWGVGITAAIITIVSYININKLVLRGTPFLPEDLQLATQAAELTQFVDVGGIVRLTIAVILIFLLTWFVDYIAKIKFSETPHHAIIPRATTIIIAVVLFMLSTSFIINHDGSRYEKVNWLDTTFTAWNQTRNYEENGFIIGFLYNWGKFRLKEPENYSEEKITEIKEKYEAEKEKTEGKNLADEDYNIVVVLNESFFDPSIIEKYYPHGGGDVTPNLHKIMKKYSSGYIYTLDYGGGTANIEFEAFTGMTNYWINTVPYTDLIPKAGDIPSIASFAKENGYKTTAIHPYNGGMYKRNISLRNEGFDTFITEIEMTHKDHEGDSEYINDRSAYMETLNVLEGSDKKQMVGLITMQNHTPYKETTYKKHDFEVAELRNDEDGRKEKIETYYQTLHESDKYLGEFIDKLEKSDEKTVVLFFGDHSAGLFHELNDSEDTSEEFTLSRTTPYFIYANFELEKSDLPKTTPNCLVNTLYNKLGVKKPTMSYLLDKLCAEQPILVGTYFGYKVPEETEILNEYRLVTYDILGGKKYWMN